MSGIIPPPIQQSYQVTGTSTSRLNELRKFTISTVFIDKYVMYDGINDGVDYINSIPMHKIIYYLGDIRFIDYLSTSGTTTGTTFSFNTVGISDPQFMSAPIYKDPTKENIVSNPKINDDVFIVRQELSVFDGIYKLEFIKNLSQLLSFAGGNFFHIANNT